MFFVTVFCMEHGIVDDVVGPFDDAAGAMNWADSESLLRTAEKSEYGRETNEELIMVANFSDESDESGWLYQVIEASSPTVDVDVRPEHTEPS